MAKRWYYKDENGNKVPVPQYKINADEYYTKAMSDSRYYEKQATDTLLAEKVDKSDIVQSTGTSETAVMSQNAVSEISDKVDELNSSLVYHDNLIVDNTTPLMQGYLDMDGTFVETSGSNTQKTTDFIAVDNAIVYKMDFLGHLSGTQYTSVRAICFYDSEKHYISKANIPSDQERLVIPQSASYIRINVNVDVVDDFSMYPLSEGKQQYLEILDNVKFNRLEELKEKVNGIGDLPTKVNTTIDLYDPYIASLAKTAFLQGYLGVNGEFIATTNIQKTTDFIELANGNVYELSAVGHTGTQTGLTVRVVFLYDSNKVMTRKLTIPSELTFGINYNEKYIRVNINADVIDDFYIRVKGGYVTGVIKDDVKYERLQNVESRIKSIWQGGYIHSRRATIAFIIDGYYQYNQNRIDIFEKHGIKVGIAPQYTAFKDKYQVQSFDKIKTCIRWQKDGHEILAHLNYILNETTSIDDETAKGYIREAQRVMSARSLVVNGCIGSSGEVAERFLPTIKQCFAYGATKNNHQGESIPIHKYDTADAYKLWRYSLHNSTPEQQKNAVDMAIENNALLLFYGHANSADDYFSDENLDSLLEYIDTKRNDFLCQVKTPFDAITDFFSIRKEDLL